MKYPKRINVKISNETYKAFEEIKKENNDKISYRTAIEFFIECYFNPNSVNGLKLKKFLQETKIKGLKREIESINNDLVREETEYESILNNLQNRSSSFNINDYNERIIEIVTTFIEQHEIVSVNDIEKHQAFNLKLKTTGLKENEFKELLNYLINKR